MMFKNNFNEKIIIKVDIRSLFQDDNLAKMTKLKVVILRGRKFGKLMNDHSFINDKMSSTCLGLFFHPAWKLFQNKLTFLIYLRFLYLFDIIIFIKRLYLWSHFATGKFGPNLSVLLFFWPSFPWGWEPACPWKDSPKT